MDLNFNAKLLFSASVEPPGTGDGAAGPNVTDFQNSESIKVGEGANSWHLPRCQQCPCGTIQT
jgi:hypothetical protein